MARELGLTRETIHMVATIRYDYPNVQSFILLFVQCYQPKSTVQQ